MVEPSTPAPSRVTWDLAIRVTGLGAWWAVALDVLVGSLVAGNVGAYAVRPRPRLRWHSRIGYTLGALGATHVAVVVLSNSHQSQTVNAWRPTNATLARETGILTAVALAAVLVTSALRACISRAWWARFHMLTLPVLAAGTVHGITAGPDESSLYVVIPGVATLSFLAAVTAARLYKTHYRTINRRAPQPKKEP